MDLVSASEDYRNMVGVRDEEVMRELGRRVKEGETPDTNDIILIVFWQVCTFTTLCISILIIQLK